MAEQKARMRAIVKGIVQGVGYRYFAVYQAQRIGGIVGFVRNLRDGNVEVVAEGERERLEQFLQELRKGPRAAHVTDLEVFWEHPTGEFTNFGIRW
ncbi:MAG: acylphosphatase [Armatimonadetes bacterium]|nr:acylphosphatase [Armatimonadota bacterium]MDW8029386.1 acylphosphatase [Armatimonadota bacterium]